MDYDISRAISKCQVKGLQFLALNRKNAPMRWVSIIVIVFATTAPALAQVSPVSRPAVTGLGGQGAALAVALEHAGAEDWDAAQKAAVAAGPIAQDIITWQRLRASAGTWDAALGFLQRRPDWPGLPLLRKSVEPTIPPTARAADVTGFFAGSQPRTLMGSLRLAQAYRALGDEAQAEAAIVRGWTRFVGGEGAEGKAGKAEQEERAVLAEFAPFVVAHHAARLNTLLWQRETGAALRQIERVGQAQAALARARVALQARSPNASALVAAVPRSLADDPGLARDRFEYRLRTGQQTAAIGLLLERSASAAKLGQPEAWAARRLSLARSLKQEDRPRQAYRIASQHHLTRGRTYAALEWLSGYIALRRLNNPARALIHFQNHGKAVSTPISKARAHYWQGRAFEALDQEAKAMAAYRAGGAYQTTFYGLLSAEKAGMSLNPALTGREVFAGYETAAFRQSSVFAAAEAFFAAGDLRQGIRFMTHLAENQTRSGIGHMTAYAEATGRPYLELWLAKRGVRYGHLIERAFLPLHPLVQHTGVVPPELALAIARRESEFLPDAQSRAGALGLMQLMPGTAKEMAGKIGVPYRPKALLREPGYNAKLGIAYLRELQSEFGRSPVLVAAAYNAGPSRPRQWVKDNGDLGQSDVDIVDWIENIPFRETRNYVMRVTETLPGYRARLTGQTGLVRFTQDLLGHHATTPAAAPRTSLRPVAR